LCANRYPRTLCSSPSPSLYPLVSISCSLIVWSDCDHATYFDGFRVAFFALPATQNVLLWFVCCCCCWCRVSSNCTDGYCVVDTLPDTRPLFAASSSDVSSDVSRDVSSDVENGAMATRKQPCLRLANIYFVIAIVVFSFFFVFYIP